MYCRADATIKQVPEKHFHIKVVLLPFKMVSNCNKYQTYYVSTFFLNDLYFIRPIAGGHGMKAIKILIKYMMTIIHRL